MYNKNAYIFRQEVGLMILMLGIATVMFGGTAMGFHKLADMPILEVCLWIITFVLFLCFEASLHA